MGSYLTRDSSDGWMKQRGFVDDKTLKEQESKKGQWEGATIKSLNLAKAITIPAAISITNAIDIMKQNNFDQLPVTSASDSKHCVGLVTLGGLLAKLGSNRVQLNDPASKAMYTFKVGKKFQEITMDTPLETLTKFFETNSSAVVTRKSEHGELLIESVVTYYDLLTFLTQKKLKV